MSINFAFANEKFHLKRLKLPTRYYYFNEGENYIKLLSIGEGIFPKDRLHTSLTLDNSNCIVTTESATKVYPSTKAYGSNKIDITLSHGANLEFINDELILYKDARLLQFVNLKADAYSTFFYVDIISPGRSFENYDFSSLRMRNRFIIENRLEYFENFEMEGAAFKDYLHRHQTQQNIFGKIYIKTLDNEYFLNTLAKEGFESFSYTRGKKILMGVVSAHNMAKLKQKMEKMWHLYRKTLQKEAFNLGKQ